MLPAISGLFYKIQDRLISELLFFLLMNKWGKCGLLRSHQNFSEYESGYWRIFEYSWANAAGLQTAGAWRLPWNIAKSLTLQTRGSCCCQSRSWIYVCRFSKKLKLKCFVAQCACGTWYGAAPHVSSCYLSQKNKPLKSLIRTGFLQLKGLIFNCKLTHDSLWWSVWITPMKGNYFAL